MLRNIQTYLSKCKLCSNVESNACRNHKNETLWLKYNKLKRAQELS